MEPTEHSEPRRFYGRPADRSLQALSARVLAAQFPVGRVGFLASRRADSQTRLHPPDTMPRRAMLGSRNISHFKDPSVTFSYRCTHQSYCGCMVENLLTHLPPRLSRMDRFYLTGLDGRATRGMAVESGPRRNSHNSRAIVVCTAPTGFL